MLPLKPSWTRLDLDLDCYLILYQSPFFFSQKEEVYEIRSIRGSGNKDGYSLCGAIIVQLEKILNILYKIHRILFNFFIKL